MTAMEELKLRLIETLSEADAAHPSADALKNHWWLICHAMRAAIKELRQVENEAVPQTRTVYEPT